MTSVWLFCVLFFYAFLCSCTADKPSCKKTLSLCKLQLGDDESINFPKIGPKGEKGAIGLRGEKGDYGMAGHPGQPGKPGDQGVQGPGGIKFMGEIGDMGEDGLKGIKGNQGDLGPIGMLGRTGPRGDKGIPGPIGPPGLPGINGSCPCPQGSRTREDDDYIKKLCKDSPTTVTKKYSLELSEDYSIDVGCVLRTNVSALTCIPPKDPSNPETYTFTNISTGFWLSNKNFTLDELYGISRRDITWIQKRSNAAFQTIRYHCYNSNPFPRDNVDKSLLLLTWNDNTIGPMPTMTKPFFYSVVYDGCSNNIKDTWSYTDIRLYSVSPRRVPVIDFFIRDVGNIISQQFKIEHIELCFD